MIDLPSASILARVLFIPCLHFGATTSSSKLDPSAELDPLLALVDERVLILLSPDDTALAMT